MPQSLCRLVTHLVFSTKYRRPMIPTEFESELSAYLGGTLKGLDCRPVEISCVADHAHLLFVLSKKQAPQEVFKEVKRISSKWVKTKMESLRSFYWQGGYAAFSVSESKVPDVRRYIHRQREHHRRTSFQEELRELLKRHKVEFDERYIWD